MAAAFLCAVTPGSAQAGTVDYFPGERPPPGCASPSCANLNRPSVLTFVAAPGEANDVVLEAGEDGSARITDRGAPLTATRGCTAVDDRTVTCPGALAERHYQFIRLYLADGDDRDESRWPGFVEIFGGPGADRLTGGPNAERLVGEAGPDVLRGGPGNDSLQGDGRVGDNTRIEPADDVLDGGEGLDGVAYAGGPMVVDLADPGPDGFPGEADRLTAIESAFAGEGAVLLGDEGPNTLHARGGARIEGRGGDDLLEDATALDGGAGDDRLVRSDRGGTLRCGPGQDSIRIVQRDVAIDGDCELDEFREGVLAHRFPTLSGTLLEVRLGSRRDGSPFRRLELRAGALPLAQLRPAPFARPTLLAIRVPLFPWQARLLRRVGRVTVADEGRPLIDLRLAG